MELHIGENIRQLRRERGMTQEQLAERLNLSTAAVSKWETGSAYPDITLVIPLAQVFDVSIDELMDYNVAKMDTEIENIISKYFRLMGEGKYNECRDLLVKARQDYPNDFRIMNWYMQDLIGGSTDNDPNIIREHKDELLSICNFIIEGCNVEGFRLEAMTIKAKVLHAEGDTEGALEILKQFPTFYQSSGQKTEQLFAKGTSEFRAQLRRNLYELADFTANKMIKDIWYNPNVELSERIRRCEKICDCFAEMYKRTGQSVFIVFEYSASGEFSNVTHNRGGSKEDYEKAHERWLKVRNEVIELSKYDSSIEDVYLPMRHIKK